MNKNFYLSEEQKHVMVANIARMHNEVVAYTRMQHVAVINATEKDDQRITPAGYDAVFQHGFKKGSRGIAHEMKLRQVRDNLNSKFAVAREDTDWTVQAVVDEDQL